MPMFDYQCRNCGHKFEELVFSSQASDENITCPNCKANDSQRLLSAPSIGSGGGTSTFSSGGCSSSSGFS